jgi:ankyrin repeat protein
MNPLMAAAAGGHAKAVEELLKHESAAKDVDTKEGWSALQHAAYFGHTDVCARLLE